MDIPLAVLPDRTHGSIISPQQNEVKSKSPYDERLGELILQALACNSPDDYQTMATQWHGIAEQTALLRKDTTLCEAVFKNKTDPDWFHQYLQVNVRVVDDHGADVTDYFLEFSGPEDERGDRSSLYFHQEVLEHVHPNQSNSAYRCLFVDRTDLLENYYDAIAGKVERALFMSISASPPGDNVSYFDNYKTGARGSVPLHFEHETKKGPAKQVRWLKRNSTHFVKIIIPRTPGKQVFKMTKA